ncbi:MAG: glycoside hydrolase family 3 N-terminal domain-containing protein [Chloroflexota bacterium]
MEDVRLSAEALLESLSPAERVGQLFLVTFEGNQIDPDSPITTLITDAHIGGVVLLPQNQNFQPQNGRSLPAHLAISTNTLQELALVGSSLQFITDTISTGDRSDIERSTQPSALPLFISTSYLDHAYLSDGLTEQPDLVAIGATWKLDRAFDAGFIYGHEMNQIGLNLVMDFPLDLLETQDGATLNPIVPNSFGSSPYWVSQMGNAYIDGINAGSSNRLAVVAGRFPGSGSSDRPFGSEIATINK